MTEQSGSATESDRTEPRDRPDHPPPLGVRARRMFVPDVIRTNLTVKLLLVLVAVWLVVAAVVTLGSVSFVDAAGENRVDAISEQSALESALVTSWVDAGVSQTRLASQHTRVPSSRDDMRTYLQSINESESVYAVYYADLESSRVITSTDSAVDDSELREVDAAWGDPLQTAAGGADDDFVAVASRSIGSYDRPTLPFVSRIGNTSRGLIVVRDATTLQRQLASGGDTRIVTAGGSPVFAPDSARVNTSTAAFDTAQRGIASGYTENGVIVQYTPVDGTDWIAVTTAPYGTPMVGSAVANWAITLIALLVSLIGTGLLVGRSITHPINRLTEDIDRLGVEDLTFDGWSYRDDEIGGAFAALRAKQRTLTSEFDETERIRREIETSRQELKRQNARLDQFASTLSHDLRNPLAIARGHTELLEMKLDATEYDEHLDKLGDAHERIDSIINDVLTLTREGESVEETESVKLEAIAREAWDNVDSGAATFEVAESRTIEVDPSRLQRALENLLRNSIDHVGEEATVTVGLTRDGFFVQDDGPGIPDEMMDTVFEYGHTTSDDGTGLGLSIVKTIAEAHGWTVWVDGTYEDGARFVFSEVFENEQVPFTETEFTWAGSLRSGPDDGVR
ncbi:sensor histidine kinase [Halococcoides cellulosivorans]|uniref:histidine kinase n=1 Tax=Halococcoides cellulosivorans TaxID=1679096 RepID=A0A2R4WZS0_9EURY|nr:ATP-binding protein [Halococcoides cellulosivorans]AWB27056.1 sensor histidine kinase [Halococcoides cellulosivorans]